MLALHRRDPGNWMMMYFGMWGLVVDVMNCGKFGFDRSRGFGSARGRFQRVAIGFRTRPYNCVDTTVLHVTENLDLAYHKCKLQAKILVQVFIIIIYTTKM